MATMGKFSREKHFTIDLYTKAFYSVILTTYISSLVCGIDAVEIFNFDLFLF